MRTPANIYSLVQIAMNAAPASTCFQRLHNRPDDELMDSDCTLSATSGRTWQAFSGAIGQLRQNASLKRHSVTQQRYRESHIQVIEKAPTNVP